MNKLIIIGIVLMYFAINHTIAQSSDRFVTIGDTSINLADVDLEKGNLFHTSEMKFSGKNNESNSVHLDMTLFSSPNSDFYAISDDSVKFSKNNIDGIASSSLKYYDKDGNVLFNKYFNDKQIFSCYISSNGESVIIELINMDEHAVHLYDITGNLVKSYGNQYERFYVGSNHNYFMICNHDNYKGPNTYDLIDKSGEIIELTFPQGHLKSINFSPRESYYIVFLNESQILYDLSNELMWEVPISKGIINILYDEKKYIINDINTNSIKIKDLFNHNLIYSIPQVTYNNESFTIFRCFVIDSNFYIIGKDTGAYIYNFFNIQGELLQTEVVSSNTPYYNYHVTKNVDKFNIKNIELNK